MTLDTQSMSSMQFILAFGMMVFSYNQTEDKDGKRKPKQTTKATTTGSFPMYPKEIDQGKAGSIFLHRAWFKEAKMYMRAVEKANILSIHETDFLVKDMPVKPDYPVKETNNLPLQDLQFKQSPSQGGGKGGSASPSKTQADQKKAQQARERALKQAHSARQAEINATYADAVEDYEDEFLDYKTDLVYWQTEERMNITNQAALYKWLYDATAKNQGARFSIMDDEISESP